MHCAKTGSRIIIRMLNCCMIAPPLFIFVFFDSLDICCGLWNIQKMLWEMVASAPFLGVYRSIVSWSFFFRMPCIDSVVSSFPVPLCMFEGSRSQACSGPLVQPKDHSQSEASYRQLNHVEPLGLNDVLSSTQCCNPLPLILNPRPPQIINTSGSFYYWGMFIIREPKRTLIMN